MSDGGHDSHGLRKGRRIAVAGRHRGSSAGDPFERSFRALGALAYTKARVSASVRDLDAAPEDPAAAVGTADVEAPADLLAIDDGVSVPTGELGVIVLLIEVAARLERGELSPLQLVHRDPAGHEGVDDPRLGGLWSALVTPALGLVDAATFVGAVHDPVATNALIRLVGFDSVVARAASLGLAKTALLDLARAHRGPDDAPQQSVGSARELRGLVHDLVQGRCVDVGVSNRVLGWLSSGTDLSMVAAAFGLDPTAHRDSDHGLQLVNLTGTDAGVRAEVGALRGRRHGVAYAVTVDFDDVDLPTRLRALDAMHTVGLDLLDYVS